MIWLIIWFFISLIILWILIMFLLWRKHENAHIVEKENIVINKFTRNLRKILFGVIRLINKIKTFIKKHLTKVLIFIFPKASKAFEVKDPLIGLEQGPSSYFLMSISEDIKSKNTTKKSRRKSKNV